MEIDRNPAEVKVEQKGRLVGEHRQVLGHENERRDDQVEDGKRKRNRVVESKEGRLGNKGKKSKKEIRCNDERRREKEMK